jgi:hypothetical protein
MAALREGLVQILAPWRVDPGSEARTSAPGKIADKRKILR